jgi:hypothetical protein
VLAHQPLHPLAIDRLPQIAGGQRGDHPAAVGRILAGGFEDGAVDLAELVGPLASAFV